MTYPSDGQEHVQPVILHTQPPTSAHINITPNDFSTQEVQALFESAKTECPAFKNGCPYAKIQMPMVLKSNCPAFKNGCPFNGKSTNDIIELLRQVPHEHKQCPAINHGKVTDLKACTDGESVLGSLQRIRLDLFKIDNTPVTTLAQDLRSGTAKAHRAAERSEFIKYYLRGKLNKQIYGTFLLSLYHVYSALEDVLDQHAENEQLNPIYFADQLRRAPALIKDLEYFVGPTWSERVKSVPAPTQTYVNRLYELSRKNPVLLVAHSYTRYLGDLSGGQILAKKTRTHMDLPEGVGTAFYEFPALENLNEFKETYRSRLNAIAIDAKTRDEIVAEANYAFILNVGMFGAYEHLVKDLENPNQDGKTDKADNVQKEVRRSRWAWGKYAGIGIWLALTIGFLHHRGHLYSLRK